MIISMIVNMNIMKKRLKSPMKKR